MSEKIKLMDFKDSALIRLAVLLLRSGVEAKLKPHSLALASEAYVELSKLPIETQEEIIRQQYITYNADGAGASGGDIWKDKP